VHRKTILTTALLLQCAVPLAAQTPQPAGPKTVFTSKDAIWLGAFAAGAAALSTLDPRITHWFQDSVRQYNKSMSRLASNFTRVQETTLTLAGLATYGIGRLSHSATVADIGWHATESIFAASVSSQIIRGPLGRSRPQVTHFDDQYDFKPFAGFGDFDYRAFPSIHAASAFAAATAVIAETSRRKPQANWIVAPVAFGIAMLPAYSRLYLGQHWASDIFMGAFMGTFAGLKVVNYSHDHPDNPIDRFFLGKSRGLSMSGDAGGVSLSWGATF
jgi:membrane-associated phospholipid phosphatase